ncbi:MAG: hypothetical protein JWQ58_1332 [Reyranella sp.]|nr:hypothetical protein [Reyranella sp.]
MTALFGDRRTQVLKNIATLAAGAFAITACASNPSYQEEAMKASDDGDFKSAKSLAQKEVERFAKPEECSSTTNVNCGTLALAYSSLADYQIRSGDTAAGERSFDRAKGALVMVAPANKPSATGIVYRDVSEAFWKAGDKRRAIAVFEEGKRRGGDSWLYTSSAAKAVEQEQKAAGVAPPSAAPGSGPGAGPGDADTRVKPILVNDPAVNDPMQGRPPSSSDPAPLTPSPLAPSPLTMTR